MDIFQVTDGLCVSMGRALYGAIFEKAMDIPAQKIPEVFESYIQALEMLNTFDAGTCAVSRELAPDEYHFLNLRAGGIIEGERCCIRVLNGDFQALEECRGFTWMDYRLDEMIKNSLYCAYFEKTDRDLLEDSDFFTDERFIAHIRNGAYSNVLKSDEREHEFRLLIGGAKVVNYVSIPHFGCISRGSLLRHKNLGVCWIYNVLIESNGGVQFEALFKRDLHHIIFGDGSNWLIYDG